MFSLARSSTAKPSSVIVASETPLALIHNLSLFLYEDMNPAILYTIKFSPGEEYKMHADFPKATYPYVVSSTTIPDNLSSDTAELLNTVLSLMDVETQSQIGISFSDFGIFYKKD